MERIRKAATAAAICCGFLIGAGGNALAGHPFVTEDAGTQGKGNVEVEFNLDLVHENDGTDTTYLGNNFTMGVAPKIDLAVGYAYGFSKANDGTKTRGMAPVAATLKAALFEGKEYVPTLAAKGGVVLPTAEGDQTWLIAIGAAQWTFEPLTIFANVGADVGTHLAGNEETTTLLRASAAGSYEFRKEWYLLSELLWWKSTSPSEPSTWIWMIGAKKEITETFSVNAGIDWGLNNHSPRVAYLVGFTLGFRGEKPAPAAASPAGEKQ